MYNKQQGQDFNNKKEGLISIFNQIPTKKTINHFIQSCFYDIINRTYKNLEEEDRENAHFDGFFATEDEWGIKKDEYYLKFPKNESLPNLDYNYFSGNTKNRIDNFKNLTITNLSIEILNFNYFEFCLDKIVNEFKELYGSITIKYLHLYKHQLYTLNDELEMSKLKYSSFENVKLNINSIDYPKLLHLVETAQKDLETFMKSFFNLTKSNNQEIVPIYNKSRRLNLLEVIDNEDNLKLFYEFEKYLENKNYIDGKSRIWSGGYGSKTSFMRFYLKCKEHKLIKRGAWGKLIRKLSDIYKIDGVVKYDFGEDRCKDALIIKPYEFRELDVVKSQHNLNLENN